MNVPNELKHMQNWVCWRLVSKPGSVKPVKVPFNPRDGEAAKANDPTTWSDYQTCLQAFDAGQYDGIGFQITPPYVGVDLDDCVVDGGVEPWAQKIVAALDSYSEFSPSGTGIHILCRGQLPNGGRRRDRIEMYDGLRYFTITARHLPDTPTTIEDRTPQLHQLHTSVFPRTTNDQQVPTAASTCFLTDDELIQRAGVARNGAQFQRLWAGEWEGIVPSASEADFSLCKMLAFWTGRDRGRIDRMLRQSGLYREKWDRQDYKERTIVKAIAVTPEIFKPSRRDRIEHLCHGNKPEER